jgi:hypothetical protein
MYIHVCKCVYIMYIYVCKCVCMYVCVAVSYQRGADSVGKVHCWREGRYGQSFKCICSFIHLFLNMIEIQTSAYKYSYTYTYIRKYVWTNMHAFIHTYMNMPLSTLNFKVVVELSR